MNETRGWFLDLYADPKDDLVAWFLTEERQALRLKQVFPVTFYAAGSGAQLAGLRRYLEDQPEPVRLYMTERRDLFAGRAISVLAVEVARVDAQARLFRQAADLFPAITYYDADTPLALRFAALFGTFALAYCRITYTDDGRLAGLEILGSPWELDPQPAPLRILTMDPDVNPAHAVPREIALHFEQFTYSLPLRPERPFLLNLKGILQRHDPDLLLTTWGDTWLLLELQRMQQRFGIRLPLNREVGRGMARRGERSYFSYGQVIHRGQQVHLFGRLHIDRCNAMMWGDYGLEGVFELARVTSLPLQTAARVSPGSGISAMQILTALHQEVLVPWHKQQPEDARSARDLFYADQGGLVYQPLLGLHRDVAAVDFISMYPSIMVHFNISPETVGQPRPGREMIPQLGLAVDRSHPGLVPLTLKPLLEKRIHLKMSLLTMPAWDPRYKRYQAYISAHKWLLVTCFGYLGYKNARFGRIEAHQAVTAYGREALIQAKEAAEDFGGTVLHLYVDGMWVVKPGAREVKDFQPLIDEIVDRTGLPLGLDGIYRWVAFLPSRRDNRIPVANRYFGVFQDGSIKVRGIEARRLDTPPFIGKAQMDMLEILARAASADGLWDQVPDALARLRRALNDLRGGRLALADCLVTQRLSRKLEEYRAPSPMSRAVTQLRSVGKEMRPGQRVRFLYTRGEPGVWAWDLPDQPPVSALDVERYRVLLLRAASTVLQPLGIEEETLRQWALGGAVAVGLPVLTG